jgi:hippurate hydrolase
MMKILIKSMVSGALLFYAAGAAAGIDASIKADTPRLVETFKKIHQNPELGFMETETSKIVADELKKLGYEVITGIAKTGVVGILKNGKGPVVMFRADMDANAVKEVTKLPYASTKTVKRGDGETVPVMHACGHDAHVAWLLGIAKVMKEQKNKWHGTLVLVAQPAEEMIEGARAMAEDPKFKKVPVPDILIAMHTAPIPTGTAILAEGLRMAGTDQIDVTFYGVGGHGSTPHLAIDPVLMAASAIIQYQFIVSRGIDAQHAAVLTVGSVQAGKDNNVIPSEALLKINLRWFEEKDREVMIKAIERINNAIAMAYGLPKSKYPKMVRKGWSVPVVNDPELVKKVRPAMARVFGEKNIFDNIPATMGSEDFHHLVIKNEKSKYLQIMIGTADPKLFEKAQKEGKLVPFNNHNPNFQVDLDAIPAGVKVGSEILLELFGTKDK